MEPDPRGGWARRESVGVTLYTNPAAENAGEHDVRNKRGSVDIQRISPELAFKAVGNQLAINLTAKDI